MKELNDDLTKINEENSKSEKWPNDVIVDCADLVKDFRIRIAAITVMPESDFVELTKQVLDVLLNAEDGNLDALNGLPRFNAMSNNRDYHRPELQLIIVSFGTSMADRLKKLGMYNQETFSYFFDRFLGHDILMSFFPF